MIAPEPVQACEVDAVPKVELLVPAAVELVPVTANPLSSQNKLETVAVFGIIDVTEIPPVLSSASTMGKLIRSPKPVILKVRVVVAGIRVPAPSFPSHCVV